MNDQRLKDPRANTNDAPMHGMVTAALILAAFTTAACLSSSTETKPAPKAGDKIVLINPEVTTSTTNTFNPFGDLAGQRFKIAATGATDSGEQYTCETPLASGFDRKDDPKDGEKELPTYGDLISFLDLNDPLAHGGRGQALRGLTFIAADCTPAQK